MEGPGTVTPRRSQTKAMCKEVGRIAGKSEWMQGPGAGWHLEDQEVLVAKGGHFLCAVLCVAREVAGG